MTKNTQTVYRDENEQDLLVLKQPGRWYIPLSSVDEPTLRNLGDAIGDALKELDASRAPKA